MIEIQGRRKEGSFEINLCLGITAARPVVRACDRYSIVLPTTSVVKLVTVLNKCLFAFVFQPPQFGSGFSSINPDVVDLNLYPGVSKVEWTYSTLEPGDCIFIPSGKVAANIILH